MATAATAAHSTLIPPLFDILNHVIVDKDLEDLTLSGDHMIYTVPSKLRNMDEVAFTPQWISIGPIHFGKEELSEMQKLKCMYFQDFWARFNEEAITIMKEYKGFLESEVQKIKECYAQQKFPGICNEKLVEIVLLDAVFIVEHLLTERQYADECMLTNYVRKGIQRDLLLLENQLPFYVLEELYNKVPASRDFPVCEFLTLALLYFKSLSLYARYSISRYDVVHFLDFVWRCCVPDEQYLNFEELFAEHAILQVNASKLYEAGVSFKCADDSCLVDVTFGTMRPFNGNLLCLGCLPSSCLENFKALLMLPPFKVDNATVTVLKNLMAYEQNRYLETPFITSYVSLWCSLVHTKEDVELLVEKECIIREQVSDKEVVNLVKELSKHVISSKTCYHQVITELTLHTKSGWKKAMGTVMRVYFRDTWRGSSTIVGICVLIFTVVSFYRNIHAIVSKQN
ncbi:hypothetical protein HN51_046603 [Arachis hypogaea]|uniref:putative UPF0481 protein At3g02645 n=1 Tax=Arachis ipaensis TaxID=130454 RepID=UPI0007AF194A|nr:putative UPF0481 protein At3g02645 [Arachis ipaensis]XP_029146852.1 putative UPF0481 protein At3g02645 [Arachis hypogaea]